MEAPSFGAQKPVLTLNFPWKFSEFTEIVNACAGPADPAFEGHNGCRRSVLGQRRKSLKMKSRGLPKSSQMRPGRLQNRFQDLSEVAPGPLPGALFSGGSWASPGALLGLSGTALDASWVAFGVPGGAPGMVL